MTNFFSINSIQNTTLHTFHMCSISLCFDNSTPTYALGDTAWTRGQIFTKILSNFMNLQKSVTLTICHRFDPKHDVAHLQSPFIRIRMDDNTPLNTFGDTAWTRSRIFPKISLVFKILSFSQFFIKSNETTTLHTFH